MTSQCRWGVRQKAFARLTKAPLLLGAGGQLGTFLVLEESSGLREEQQHREGFLQAGKEIMNALQPNKAALQILFIYLLIFIFI